jgi:histidinol-phosphate/aromatic aminotransferase/cobyric acid decarboxylase-like protein
MGRTRALRGRRSEAVVSLRLHGDALLVPGTLDFAVNVWPGARPAQVERALQAALAAPGYPDPRAARAAAAARHERAPEEVLLLNGACEAFWLLATALRPRLVACVHPGFTEPEAAFRAAGSDVSRVLREPVSWRLDPADVPAEADVVLLGNPENPTGTLEPRELVARLQRPGRLVVVDESFMEFALERETLAGDAGVVVVRSLTKLWSLACISAGYLLGPAELVAQLEAHRQPWGVNALACASIAACSADGETPARVAAEVAREREFLVAGLEGLVDQVWPGAANFLLLKGAPPLHARGITVRPCASFPGLDERYVRLAVRQHADNERLLTEIARWA